LHLLQGIVASHEERFDRRRYRIKHSHWKALERSYQWAITPHYLSWFSNSPRLQPMYTGGVTILHDLSMSKDK